ncbi:phosphotriesterase-related protein-like isoform X2 [Linepithema humile]|uniref:phosphotriesterase-related protein-like isoform X2 n=1 Tax=Linepithema humile TaxID=83485 RepID=UPI000623B770|nr:PREDICTED: phosphotriesterase-related protein-like isoform X2 [Linepithema humile]
MISVKFANDIRFIQVLERAFGRHIVKLLHYYDSKNGIKNNSVIIEIYLRETKARMSNDNNELVQTVTGPVQLDSLGITLTHEHLSCDFTKFYKDQVPWFLENHIAPLHAGFISMLKRYPYCDSNNLRFNDLDIMETMFYELSLFKNAGGKTIVENTSNGLCRDLKKLQDYSVKCEINIIAGTGYYTASVQNNSNLNLTHEEMYNKLLNDLTNEIEGEESFKIGDSNNNLKIKAGFIGEVGSNWPIHEFEKRSIRATGEIQAQLHCPVNLNPGVEEDALREVIRLYQEAGGDSKKVAISNIDRTLWYEDKFMEFMDDTKHIYVQIDLFGTEHSFCRIRNRYYKILSDAQRIKRLTKLKDEGNLDRILISHDIHTKDRLAVKRKAIYI